MSDQAKNEYDRIAKQLNAEQSQMFGKLCLKYNKKAFAAFSDNTMIFKLKDIINSGLMEKYPGSELWDPSEKHRPMREWLQVPDEFLDDWLPLAKQAHLNIQEEK